MCLNFMCPVCNQEPETVCHALISCSKVSTYFVNNNLDVNAFGTCSLAYFFLTRVPHLSKEKASTFGMILWTIWKQRNAKLWSGNSLPSLVAIQHDLLFVQEWCWVRESHLTRNHTRLLAPSRWVRPDRGCLKCNIDGAVFTKSLKVGYKYLKRDDHGLLIQASSRTILGCFSPVIVEAMALYEAVKWIIQFTTKSCGVRDRLQSKNGCLSLPQN